MTIHRTLAACLLGAFVGMGITTSVAFAEAKPLAEKVGERISRGVVEESLEALDKQENRARLGRIIGSQQMQNAMHDLTSSIVRGVFDGVRSAQKKGGLMGDTDIAKSVGDGMNKHVGPAVGKMTYRVVDSALSAALDDKHIAQMEKAGQGATKAVVAGLADGLEHDLGPALAATLDKDIGPAVARMLERDVLPAVGRGLDSPEMQSAVANLTRSVATELVAGTSEQMDAEAAKNKANGEESGFALFGGRMALGYAIAVFVAFAFGTLLVVLTVMLVRSNRRQRKQDAEARRREAALMSLLDSIETDNPTAKTDVQRLIREQLHQEP
jgi:hypothetical protein